MAPRLQLYAGPSYDTKTHMPVAVNSEEPLVLSSPYADVELAVRIKNYLAPISLDTPRSSSEGREPSSEQPKPAESKRMSPYFETAHHEADQLSIQFSVKFKEAVSGDALLWGNDFDAPIRDMLPYGASLGFKMFKRVVDPSVEGDPFSDKPYMYGLALSSINAVQAAPATEKVEWPGFLDGDNLDEHPSAPPKSKDRMKHFRDRAVTKNFEFTPDWQYSFDFYTPYLTMGDSFGIQLPGFKLDVSKYCDGQPLRYTLKNRDGKVYLVVVFRLVDA